MISFEDRVSAYPNRYLLSAEDGSTSYVVLERADEPIVVGTPLNAATFGQFQAEVAPSGYGYGEQLTEVSVSSGESYADYCAKIDTMLSAMPNNTTKQINIVPPPSEDSSFGACATTLYKGNNAYASLITIGHSNKYAYGWRMQKRSGTWEPFEWIDPPMSVGVEYRTTERWNGKPVYRKLVAYTTSSTIGNINDYTKISIPHGISGLTGVVWCKATTAWGAILPFVAEGGGVTAVNSVESSVINLRIVFDTWNPATFYFDLAYVKN